MTSTFTGPNLTYEVVQTGGAMTVRPAGRLDVESSASFIKRLAPLLRADRPSRLVVDLEQLTHLDEFGVAILAGLKARAAEVGGTFALEHVNAATREVLTFHRFEELGRLRITRKQEIGNIFTRLGEATFRFLAEQKYILTFLGTTCLALLKVFRHPRTLRWYDTLFYMARTGVDAVPIVAMISLLMGLIMAFMSAVQLQQFGANIYVASLVSLAMTRELGPIITAIIVAGRSSSAFAAEIGSMKVAEEIDALTVMGFDPYAFLVLPKVIASLLVVPLLTLFSDLFAILGGLIVGVSMLDLTFHGYLSQTYETITMFDFNWGISKSALFALLISWTGCLRGFQVRGGATAVGQAATSAVVTSIFIIILADSILAVLLTYWAPEKSQFFM